MARKTKSDASTATIGFEATLWLAADKLRTSNRAVFTSSFEIHSSNFASLPGRLFYSTQIAVCLWFFEKSEPAGKCRAATELEFALAA